MTIRISTVQDVLENYKSAVYEQDAEKFLSTYAADVHIYDCWGKWECRGIWSWRQNVIEWFNGLSEERDVLKVDFDDLTIEENTNVAFAHCAVTFVAYREQPEEKLREMTNRFTLGLRKVNESWLITHEHSSLPIDMKTGKGMFNLK
ncbi:YybH family protein [Guptibacillus hwajinpoensis]|uniref:YybH family protein n=1 Tax=Guptibacillus hwajinpoensis TaxID=208199 RepID=UPI003736A26E